MHTIDLTGWPRRHHFELYRNFAQPHFGLCAPVDLSSFRPAVQARGLSFTVALVYVLARAANELAPFRWRIRGDQVVEHKRVQPSFTVLTDEELFSFCTVPYSPEFETFAAAATAQIAHVRAHPTLEDEPGQDDLLFMSAMPWVSFTSVMHPQPTPAADSVPRIAWGKFGPDGRRLTMPLAVQAHHALMDGLHAAQYYQRVQAYLDRPAEALGTAA